MSLTKLLAAWRGTSPTHKMGWVLVAWEAGRFVISSAPLNGGVLAIAAILLGTERAQRSQSRRNGRRDDTRSSDGSGPTTSS